MQWTVLKTLRRNPTFLAHNYYDLQETEERLHIKCENQSERVDNTMYNKISKFLQNMHSETFIKHFSWD